MLTLHSETPPTGKSDSGNVGGVVGGVIGGLAAATVLFLGVRFVRNRRHRGSFLPDTADRSQPPPPKKGRAVLGSKFHTVDNVDMFEGDPSFNDHSFPPKPPSRPPKNGKKTPTEGGSFSNSKSSSVIAIATPLPAAVASRPTRGMAVRSNARVEQVQNEGML